MKLTSYFPFIVGEAVYYVADGAHNRPQVLTPGVVVSISAARVRVQFADGRRPAVVPSSLAYQGYCTACYVPAVVDPAGGLLCPRCELAATAVPPPPELTLRLWPANHNLAPQIAREAFLTGDARGAILERLRDRAHEAFEGMLQATGLYWSWRTYGAPWSTLSTSLLRVYALLGDVAAFRAYYEAHAPEPPLLDADEAPERTPEQVEQTIAWLREVIAELESELPPRPRPAGAVLRPLPQIAIDTEPSGADDLSTWLARQMQRAA